MWVNTFQWMRFFESTSHYVRMTVQTISDISTFLLIQLIFMFMFGFASYFINIDRIKQSELLGDDAGIETIIPEYFPTMPALDMFLTQYQILLGEFDVEANGAGRY
jgi:hypothetical protein